MTRFAGLWCVSLLLLGACGEENVDASGDTDASTPEDENVASIEIRGIVIDALSEDPLEDARVTALDATGVPVSGVSVTDAEGRYVVTVRGARDEDGSLVGADTWTLFATAQDYQPFPAGLRPALPLNSSDAVDDEGDDDDDDGRHWVLENPATDVALLPLPADLATGRTISGTVRGDAPGGTLVVAEGGGSAPYAIADGDGTYVLFNVATGPRTIVGYRSGLDVVPASVDGDDDLEEVDLDASSGPAVATVRGTVNIVNAPGGSTTSVVLVPVSVYNEGLERGPVPLGLRAPGAPEAPSIDGAFEIVGVPPGAYKVLAAFENDDLVRDPDTGISGTAIVEIDVTDADLDLDTSFKVTEHLEVVSPGADVPERVSGAPTFVFADDSSEDRYEVVVFDTFGERIWEALDVPGVSGSDTVEVAYDGPALESGRYYQFRATSIRETPNTVSPISRTEDLRGVFIAD